MILHKIEKYHYISFNHYEGTLLTIGEHIIINTPLEHNLWRKRPNEAAQEQILKLQMFFTPVVSANTAGVKGIEIKFPTAEEIQEEPCPVCKHPDAKLLYRNPTDKPTTRSKETYQKGVCMACLDTKVSGFIKSENTSHSIRAKDLKFIRKVLPKVQFFVHNELHFLVIFKSFHTFIQREEQDRKEYIYGYILVNPDNK